MPKKSKKKQENNENPVENTTPVNETPEATEVPAVEPEVEVTPEVEAETEAPTPEEIIVEKSPTDIFHSGLEEPKVEEPKVEAKPEKKGLSQKQMFEKAIETKPFTIYQNGILVCHHSDFVKITVTDKYFEINFRKFSYDGIEIKYI